MERTDAELVAACRAGDETAWETLVGRYERLVYAIARRSGLDADQATEIYQRVFAILVERLYTIEQPALIGAWLSRTTVYEVWQVRRRARAEDRQEMDEASAAELSDGGPAPGDLLLLAEEQRRVREAVAALDGRCRELIRLLFYAAEPAPYSTIAATMGMPTGSVGPTRARCLEKLRKLLDEPES